MPLMRGARLSPRHILAATSPHISGPAPASFFRLAKSPLPVFGNDRYGDCVTAEEFSAKAADGHLGTDTEAIDTARNWGGLNGADLATILDYAAAGFTVGGVRVADGGRQTVNYLSWDNLTSAIYQGQVKIAVGANALQHAGAGSGRPWAIGQAYAESIDHCIGIAGYGTWAECCQAIGYNTGVNIGDATPSLVGETWGDYGVIAYVGGLLPIMNSSPTRGNSEAWLRVPTTIIPSPDPSPTPTPGPTPTPPSPGPCPWRREDVEAYAHAITRGVAAGLRSMH